MSGNEERKENGCRELERERDERVMKVRSTGKEEVDLRRLNKKTKGYKRKTRSKPAMSPFHIPSPGHD